MLSAAKELEVIYMRANTLIITLFLGLFLSSCSSLYWMTKEDVVKMSQAGVSDTVITEQIRATSADFYLTAEDIIKLKQAGVSDNVIGAMVKTRSDRINYFETLDSMNSGYISACPYYESRIREKGLTEEEILKMTKAGLSDQLVIAHIKMKGVSFEPSTDDIVRLKNSGVSEKVIEAIIRSNEERTKIQYNINYYPYFPLFDRYYRWYYLPYYWRNTYVPFINHDLSIAHPTYKYWRWNRTGYPR